MFSGAVEVDAERRIRSRRHIVVNQRVSSAKAHAAREMRRHMTTEEQVLCQAIKANRLNGLHFRRQQIIDGFIVDFYCHAVGRIVEVDGSVHQAQAEYDALRDNILPARNLAILRVSNEDVRRNLPAVLARITAKPEDRVRESLSCRIDQPLPSQGRGPGS